MTGQDQHDDPSDRGDGAFTSALPVEHLIAAPLVAAARAATSMAEASADTITAVGLDGDGNPRMVTLDYTEPVDGPDGSPTTRDMRISLPLLALVGVPTLRVEALETSFNVEVHAVRHGVGEAEGAAGPSLIATPSAHREHTRDTDKAAKCSINLRAAAAPTPEAFARALDLLAQSIAPAPRTPLESTDAPPSR